MSPDPLPLPDPLRAVRLMRKFGLGPDPWQADVLYGRHPRLILNCCRQVGKSTAVAFLALAETLFSADTFVVIVCRSLRQSTELFQILADHYTRLDKPLCQNFRRHELRLAR